MKILEDLGSLVNDLADLECMFVQDIDCYTQFAQGKLDLDDLCMSCRAKEIVNREQGI